MDEGESLCGRRISWPALAEHLIKKHLKQQTRRPVSDYYSDDLIEAVDDYVSFVVSEIEAARKECLIRFSL